MVQEATPCYCMQAFLQDAKLQLVQSVRQQEAAAQAAADKYGMLHLLVFCAWHTRSHCRAWLAAGKLLPVTSSLVAQGQVPISATGAAQQAASAALQQVCARRV